METKPRHEVAYRSALQTLYSLEGRGIEPGLTRIEAALQRLGNPHRQLKIIHVAGTNGKGSVSNWIAHGLADGSRVGLFTSPHLHCITERTRILHQNEFNHRESWLRAWEQVRPIILDSNPIPLTFFEAVTLIAFVLFQQQQCQWAVLETGLGGRLDSTNVDADKALCVITRIAMDHQRFLGDSIQLIAREKAGILRAEVPTIVAPQSDAALDVIQNYAQRIETPLIRIGHDTQIQEISTSEIDLAYGDTTHRLKPCLAGQHQLENAAVAATALLTLAEQGAHINLRSIAEVNWPGRLEWVDHHGTRILLDAAHNPNAVHALSAYLREHSLRPRLIFGAMRDKAWRAMLQTLVPLCRDVRYAQPNTPRAASPELFTEVHKGKVFTCSLDAFEDALGDDANQSPILVAGSLFLVSEIRAKALGIQTDPVIPL